MNRNTNKEVLDIVGSFPKYDKYKKKFGRGKNFDFKFVITRESMGEHDHPGLHYTGISTWSELRYVYKVSRVDMINLIEKKSIIHTYKDPDNKFYSGKIKFIDREPTEEEWNKEMDELKKSDRKFWLIFGIIVFVILVIFNK